MRYRFKVVRGSVRANGQRYGEGKTVTVEGKDAAAALEATGCVEPDGHDAEDGDDDVYGQDKANADLLADIGDVLGEVEGLPPELDLHSMVVWVRNTLDAMRQVMKSITETLAVAVPPPPADLSVDDQVSWLVTEWAKLAAAKSDPGTAAEDKPKPDTKPGAKPAKAPAK